MRILVTNDDGIKGEGLRRLVAWCRNLGQTLVVAPKTEQSARGQGIVLHRPIEVKKSCEFDDLSVQSYTVESTPADCVRFAVDRLGDFDIVFSGINKGLNIGLDVAYSGTCGACFEAAHWGISSVAFSTTPDGFEVASRSLDMVWRYFCDNRLLNLCVLYNVNIPQTEPKGILPVSLGGPYYLDHFVPCGEDLYTLSPYVPYRLEEHPTIVTDLDAIFSGYCSITPLTIHRTNYSVLGKLKRTDPDGGA